MHANSKKSTCPRGHPYDFVDTAGARQCSICKKDYRQSRKEYFKRKNDEWIARNPGRKRELHRQWVSKNHEARLLSGRKHQQENRESRNAKSRAYYHANKAARAVVAKRWRQENPHKVAASGARRRARERFAAPSWRSEEVIGEFYARAGDISRVTGIPHEVDHILPIAGKAVCGLHVEFNLQILPQLENRAKRNYIREHL